MSGSPPGSDAALRETLAELHERLEASKTLDAAVREELRRTVAEIEAHLEERGGEAAPESLGERLSGIVERFEGSHPRLAEALGRVVNGLSELGI